VVTEREATKHLKKTEEKNDRPPQGKGDDIQVAAAAAAIYHNNNNKTTHL